ncbi:efflux RND transporter periplasmic adaptor subunit [Myxococcota bacterium]|nr:efflux RND transporter periplasmic adaptor subunit [Myxococcota bacterium]
MTRLQRSAPFASAVAAASLLLAAGCRPPAGGDAPASDTAAPAEASRVRFATPESLSFVPQAVATGELRPEQSAMLAFGIPGRLERVAVRRGVTVKKGEALAVLDSGAASASLAQARAGLSAARAQLRMAEDALQRITPLREQQGVADAQLVQVQGQRDLALAQVEAAEAQVRAAEVHLGNHTLRAPFTGLVTRVPDGAGVAVNPGVPLMAMETAGALVLDTTLPEQDAAGVRVGDAAEVEAAVGGALVKEAGTVRAVLPSADPMTHRVPVEIAVPNPEGRFFAHTFARATLPAGRPRQALRIPSGALVQRGSGFFVWSVGGDGTARLAAVRLLAQEGPQAVVEPAGEPLPPGARVVDLPPSDLVDGALVAAVSRE